MGRVAVTGAAQLLLMLPQEPAAAELATGWWLLRDGALAEHGCDGRWAEIARGHPGLEITGLVSSALVRLHFIGHPTEVASERQALGIARLNAVQASLGEEATLHSAAGLLPGGGTIVAAVIANHRMVELLEWGERAGATLHHLVPSGLLLPLRDEWTAAALGSERVSGRRGMVVPAEPALSDHLVDGELHWLSDAEIEAGLTVLGAAPPLDLRIGRFRRRKAILIDRGRIRELTMLAATIAITAILYVVVLIAKLDASTNRLDAETLAAARAVTRSNVSLATVEATLAPLAAVRGGTAMAPPLSALLEQMQRHPTVSSTRLGYDMDRTLSVALASPNAQAINQLLLALQQQGYKITAVPRQSTDGRTITDVTIRETM